MTRKIAFIHDRLVYYGWADKLFFELIKIEQANKTFDEAKIFTLISKERYLTINNQEHKVETALPRRINDWFIYNSTQIDKKKNWFTKIVARVFNYRNLIVFYPILMKQLERKIKKYNPEKAIISSANISKNIKFSERTYTKLYLHSPLMYIHPEFSSSIKNFNRATRLLLKRISPRLNKWDKKFTKYSEVRCNSFHTAILAKNTYGFEAKVAYPKVPNRDKYILSEPTYELSNHYVYVWRLVNSLRHVDKMIKLFNSLGEKLVIIGDWADWAYLRRLAKSNIEFKWHVDNRDYIIEQVRNAKGYINLAFESSGMGTAEALMLGVPVFWYNKGWTAELVDETMGTLVPNLEENTIHDYFKKFQQTNFDRLAIKEKTKKRLNKYGWQQLVKSIDTTNPNVS